MTPNDDTNEAHELLKLTSARGDRYLRAQASDDARARLTLEVRTHGPAEPVAITLTQREAEKLAHYATQANVDEMGPTKIAVTPKDHRVLADLGISRRKDGRWGFKLRCAHRRCGNEVDQCFCADGLLEAVRIASTDRANTTCSTVCWAAIGWLADHLAEVPTETFDQDPEAWIEDQIGYTAADLWMELHPHAKRDAIENDKTIWDALQALTESWRYRNNPPTELRNEINTKLKDAIAEVYDPGAVDHDYHPNACACEV